MREGATKMDITFLGSGCVKLNGKQVTIICDPFDQQSGLGRVKATPEAVLYSSPQRQEISGMAIEGPGEYEIKGTLITGVPARLHIDAEGEKGTSYSVRMDGINVVFLGNVDGNLSDAQVEALGQVDVLVVPVGGHGLTLDAPAAAKVVSQLEPKIVIPTHFDDGKTKYPVPQEGVEKFLNEMGVKPEPMTKLKLQSKELPLETTVVQLEAVTG
jgi:L-ascorbate metabolism protein UlaG (beta-lactamase superfamily)